jgi:uncharacterized protein YndB with AHSA1/START domain
MNKKSRTYIISLLLLLGLSPAFAGTETRTVEATTNISASPGEVLEAFLDDGDLKAWWKVSRTLVEQKEGGVWSITWDDWGDEKTHHAWIGVIENLTADRLVIGHLVMIEPDMPLLGPMQLEIRVKPARGGTTLTLSHRGYQYGDHWDKIYDMVVNGWDHVLGDMEAWVQEEY